MFSLIGAWTNNGDASDLRHNHTHNDVIVMKEMINLSTFGDGISRNSVKDQDNLSCPRPVKIGFVL